MRRIELTLSILTLLVVLTWAGACTTPAPSATPGKDGFPQWDPSGTRIAFSSDRDGVEGIYVISSEGTDVVRLTPDPGSTEFWPVWSPDGTQIAVSSIRGEVYDIKVVNADGSGGVNLTEGSPFDWFESWSPDGSKMVFQSNRDGDFELYLMNRDGTGLRRLTNHPGYDGWARWSPDGSWIVFHSVSEEGNSDIYRMNSDGTGLTRLTDDPSMDGSASWLSDGTKILFESERDSETQIYMMDPDGSHQTRLTQSGSVNRNALPSPDGGRFAFQSNRDGNWEIYLMDIAGTPPTNLTADPGWDQQPSWSPDGKRIVFRSDRGVPGILLGDIFSVRADGAELRNLTGDDSMPGTEVRDVRYGPFERNVLDLWLVDSPSPTPLVVFYHGGAFRGGDKRGTMLPPLLYKLLEAGISVAGVNYRLTDTAPYPAQMLDCARALQFLRYHALDYNLDADRMGATGGSAGAVISMWLAFHDDLANSESPDPVLRQSTRLSAIVPYNGPGSLDPRFHMERFDTEEIHSAFLPFFGIRGPGDLQDPAKIALFEEASAITHVTADDPPVFMYYDQPDEPLPVGATGDEYVHHPELGRPLKEELDRLGVPVFFRLREESPGGPPFDEYVSFFRRAFGMSERQ